MPQPKPGKEYRNSRWIDATHICSAAHERLSREAGADGCGGGDIAASPAAPPPCTWAWGCGLHNPIYQSGQVHYMRELNIKLLQELDCAPQVAEDSRFPGTPRGGVVL